MNPIDSDLSFKGPGYTWQIFCYFYDEDNFCDSLFAFSHT